MLRLRSYQWKHHIALFGILFWLFTRMILRGLAWVAAEMAWVMLSPLPATGEYAQHEVQYQYVYQRQAQ
ncbi:MAG: hypothetical protein IMW89_09855 [Ktedonobacteraceae bacterium]|nr:hypothetical protein [Ktedonobacteraceae bacterium]